jgi:RNA polymerase sigma-70 factor (ECF subfamily)
MDSTKSAFVERLFAEYRGALQTYFHRRLRTKSEAPDLAQEVYLRMLRVSDTEAIRDPQRYLYSVASNLMKERALLDRRRSQSADLEAADVQEQLSHLPSFDADFDAAREAGALRAAIGRLPERWRTALILHYRYDLTYDQIGQRLSVSTTMVKRYVAQALGRCRCELAAKE